MVPVKEAINSGAWLHCEYQNEDYELDTLIKFRIKIKSLQKINLKHIDEPEEIGILDENANLWLMKIEFINLNKKPLDDFYGPNQLILIDQEGFNFHIFEDSHICCHSKFAKKTKLIRFTCLSDDLSPKIKAIGALLFQLPDDDEAEYFIALKENGIVQEA